MICDTPPPQRSTSAATSWAPVPAAATTPTRPGRTSLAKPRQVPPSIAVPAPGPITNRPSPTARCFSSTSASTDTLSLNSSTCRPAVSALCASNAAYSPGTEITATAASGSRSSASASVRAGCSTAGPELDRSANMAASPASTAAATASWSAARTATNRSFAPAPASSSSAKPSAARMSRLPGVAMAAAAQSTPSLVSSARVPDSCTTESTYVSG